MARVFLVGRLAETIKTTKANGTVVANFTIIDNDVKGGKEFVKCTAWNNPALELEKHTHKGMLIEIYGHLKTSKQLVDNKYQVIHTFVQVEEYKYLEAKKKDYSLFDLET